jgi:hypothetical protein
MLKIVLAFVAAACFSIWGLAYYQDHHATYPYTKAPQPDPHPMTEEQINCDLEGNYSGSSAKQKAEYHREFIAGCKAWLVANGRPNENPDRDTVAEKPAPEKPRIIASSPEDALKHWQERTRGMSFRQKAELYCQGDPETDRETSRDLADRYREIEAEQPATREEEQRRQMRLTVAGEWMEHYAASKATCENSLMTGFTALPGEGEPPLREKMRKQAQYDIQMGAGK